MRARELQQIQNTGHCGINSLFAKAHSADWDFEKDVDWSASVEADDPLIDPSWSAFGRTATFRSLPELAQNYATRRELGRLLNILKVGESVAQDVCAKIGLAVEEDDYRNHAAAQAMDEARHHLAYVRFLDKMGEEVEDIDAPTEMLFDSILALEAPHQLIAAEQLYLESLAMDIFERVRDSATHPLLRNILTLITRDESRHVGFGILYTEEWMKQQPPERRLRFAAYWLGHMLAIAHDKPGPILLARTLTRLSDAGIGDLEELGPAMLAEQREINAAEHAEAAAGRKVPHVLKSARRAGLLAPEVLAALGVTNDPLIRGALSVRDGA